MSSGFADAAAAPPLTARSETEVLAIAEKFENEWQQTAALGLAVGDCPRQDPSRTSGLNEKVEADATGETEDERIMRALQHPASKMQFTFVEDDEELRRIIEGGDFGAWRVFLHPEQATVRDTQLQRAVPAHGWCRNRQDGRAAAPCAEPRARRIRGIASSSRPSREPSRRTCAATSNGSTPTCGSHEGLGEPGVLVRGVDQLVERGPWQGRRRVCGAAAQPCSAPRSSRASARCRARQRLA